MLRLIIACIALLQQEPSGDPAGLRTLLLKLEQRDALLRTLYLEYEAHSTSKGNFPWDETGWWAYKDDTLSSGSQLTFKGKVPVPVHVTWDGVKLCQLSGSRLIA